MDRDEYARAYAAGYAAGIADSGPTAVSPVLTVKDLQKRYGVGENKAQNILRAIRRHCNGGKLDSCSTVLLSEAQYWEGLVDKMYKERL